MKTRRLRQLHLQNNKLKCISDRAFDKLKVRSKFSFFLHFWKISKFSAEISFAILNVNKSVWKFSIWRKINFHIFQTNFLIKMSISKF